MIVYVDKNYKCHASSDGTMREVNSDFFNDKCPTFIDGYCYDDSKGYPHIYPYKPFNELYAAQRVYEKSQLAEYEALINELYAEVTA